MTVGLRHTLAISAAALFGLAASPAHAQQVELGVTGGVHLFSDTNELGVPDGKNATSEDNAGMYGVRLGVMFWRDILGLEGEGFVLPTASRHEPHSSATDLVYRAQLIAQARAGNPENMVIPFIVGGFGGMSIVSTDNKAVLAKDTDPVWYVGVGAKLRLKHDLGVRLDGRLLFPPASDTHGNTVDGEVLLSLYLELNRPHHEAPPPAAPKDSDGDGITDDKDKCPNEPEDKDGFQDEDGCPDPDNDGDGVPDTKDKCPLVAEDKDGFQDEDGCPDPDNDGDGILDAKDKCPDEAEDKDGFQDEDGCPDPDNDGDGILDAKDKCPNQPETKNGYQDEDGCPDELPAALKKFTGTVEGVNFKLGSAELLGTSNKTLDAAVKVFAQFPTLTFEIGGHTDDQAMGKHGKFADNEALSQARADSVKAYLVKHGIAENRMTTKGYGASVPVVDPTGLKGGKLNAARAKNRRTEFKLLTK
jgi:OOP family OmpA-OmpF porin